MPVSDAFGNRGSDYIKSLIMEGNGKDEIEFRSFHDYETDRIKYLEREPIKVRLESVKRNSQVDEQKK
jgi:hypothetical protein